MPLVYTLYLHIRFFSAYKLPDIYTENYIAERFSYESPSAFSISERR